MEQFLHIIGHSWNLKDKNWYMFIKHDICKLSESKLPIIVKGVMRAEDADIAVRCGVKGIIVSNHGGRQLDFTPATVNIFLFSTRSCISLYLFISSKYTNRDFHVIF